MESMKGGSGSDASSEENDRADQVKGDSTGAAAAISASTATRRSYECIFCKRGFTNAQALGGHMNIHRKDRAKAKQITTSSVPSCRSMNEEEYIDPSYTSSIAAKHTPVLDSETSYRMYFQPSVFSSSPKLHQHGYFDSDFVGPRSQSSIINEELSGANLSLRMGSAHVEGNEFRRGIMKEDDIDLELRLGHHHNP